MDLSIIIVNYNTKEPLKKLLFSFKRSNFGKYKTEVIIVDNASIDGSTLMIKKKFPLVNLITNKENLGYTKANNQAIKQAKGKYILLLNSDTLLEKDSLFKMLCFMDENQQWGAATCKVELANGKVDPACHRGFPTPWAALTYFSGLESFFPQSRFFGQYHQTWKNLNTPHQVDVISGAFFFIRKKVLKDVGLLDERFFVYAEDIDLCLRFKEKGHLICYNPNTKITHYKMLSGRKKAKDKLVQKKSRQYFFETMKLFYDKHYQDKYSWITRKIVLLGIWIVSKFKK